MERRGREGGGKGEGGKEGGGEGEGGEEEEEVVGVSSEYMTSMGYRSMSPLLPTPRYSVHMLV